MAHINHPLVEDAYSGNDRAYRTSVWSKTGSNIMLDRRSIFALALGLLIVYTPRGDRTCLIILSGKKLAHGRKRGGDTQKGEAASIWCC